MSSRCGDILKLRWLAGIPGQCSLSPPSISGPDTLWAQPGSATLGIGTGLLGVLSSAGATLPDVCEIGWTWLAPEAQRTGVNTEAKLLMLTLAFESRLVHRVNFRTDARNKRSRAGIERLGAHLDGVLRTDKVASDGAIRDSAYYSILDSEWPAVKQVLTAGLRPRSG
jgi:RimJ/RimL family protein N-acetyltransferase